MKILHTLFLSLTISLTGFAQFDFQHDTFELSLANNELRYVGILIENSGSSSDLEYKWTETDRQLNTAWEVQFCDCRTCYSDYHSIALDTTVDCDGIYKLDAGSDFAGFKFYVDPKMEDGEGFLSVAFNGINGNNARGEVTFRARFTPLSVEESGITEFNVYPNPAADYLTLNYKAFNTEKVTVSVFNLLGAQVMTRTMAAGQMVHVMDISELSSGTYLLRMQDSSGKSLKTAKFNVF